MPATVMKRIKAPRMPDSVVTEDVVRQAVERGRLRNPVTTHTFTLHCELPTDDADPDEYVDALAEAGCTDATVGVGRRGRIALEFARKAMSYTDAVASAIDDVSAAFPGVRGIEILERDDSSP